MSVAIVYALVAIAFAVLASGAKNPGVRTTYSVIVFAWIGMAVAALR